MHCRVVQPPTDVDVGTWWTLGCVLQLLFYYLLLQSKMAQSAILAYTSPNPSSPFSPSFTPRIIERIAR